MKYEQESQAIIEAIGGRENLANAFHCMTRLRLEVKDPAKVDVDALGKVNKVLKVVQVGQQFQCVFGPQVSDVYKDFCEVAGLEQQAMVDDEPDGAPVEKKPRDLSPKGVLDTVIDYISGCIQPLLVGIIAAGMIKMVASLLGDGMLGLIPADSNIMTALTFAGDAPFYFLPVMVGYTAAKKFNMSPVLGMILGGILVHPTVEAIVAAGEPFDVFGLPMTLVDYSSSVVPMILTCWVASYVERFLNKHIPAMFRMMAVMPLTILIMLPVMLCGLAPLGNIIGQGLAGVFNGIQQLLGPIGVALISGVWMVLIMTGMHLPVFMSVAVTYFSQGHEDVILVAGTIATVAVTGVVLGYFLTSKKQENKELGLSCFTASLLGGVAEPALFGIMLPNPRIFVYEAIGAAVGSGIASLLGAGVYTIGGGGTIMGWLGFMGADTANLVSGTIGYVTAFLVPLILTLVLGFDEDATK